MAPDVNLALLERGAKACGEAFPDDGAKQTCVKVECFGACSAIKITRESSSSGNRLTALVMPMRIE